VRREDTQADERSGGRPISSRHRARVDNPERRLANKAIFRRFYERAWNQGDVGVVDELLAPGFVNHALGGVPGPHREPYKRAIAENGRDFPAYRLVIEDMIAEGDRVAARWSARAVFAGDGPDDPRAGVEIADAGITVVRIRDGKITDFWKASDGVGVLRQLGKLS